MKEDLICGVAILLFLVLLYLLTTIFIKTGEAVDRYKMKKKTDKIKVSQRYEHKNYFKGWIFFTKMQGKIYGSILDFLEIKCYPF